MCKFCDIIAGRRKKDILFQDSRVAVFQELRKGHKVLRFRGIELSTKDRPGKAVSREVYPLRIGWKG